MPIETDAVHGYDINFRINPSYSGALIEAGCDNGPGDEVADDILVDIGFDAEGKLDRSAIISLSTSNSNRSVYIQGLYDQFNGKKLTSNRTLASTAVKIYDGPTQSFVNEDENGNLYASFQGTGGNFENADMSTNLTTFSVFARLNIPTTRATDFCVMGIGANSGHIGRSSSSGSTSTNIVSNFGSNSKEFWNDTELFTRGELHSEATANDDWSIFSSTNLVFPDPSPDGFRFGYGRFTAMGDDTYFTTLIFYSGDKDADRSTIQADITDLYTPLVYPTGPVTFESAARPNAPASILMFSDLTQASFEHVENVLADANGDIIGTSERDATKHYMFVARDLAADYTGTIAAVSGTGDVEIDTGLDLSDLNMGTDHYAFRATSGSNAGEEVTVLSRSGNTITLRSNPGFQAGDEFVFGRVLKGTSDILLAD